MSYEYDYYHEEKEAKYYRPKISLILFIVGIAFYYTCLYFATNFAQDMGLGDSLLWIRYFGIIGLILMAISLIRLKNIEKHFLVSFVACIIYIITGTAWLTLYALTDFNVIALTQSIQQALDIISIINILVEGVLMVFFILGVHAITDHWRKLNIIVKIVIVAYIVVTLWNVTDGVLILLQVAVPDTFIMRVLYKITNILSFAKLLGAIIIIFVAMFSVD